MLVSYEVNQGIVFGLSNGDMNWRGQLLSVTRRDLLITASNHRVPTPVCVYKAFAAERSSKLILLSLSVVIINMPNKSMYCVTTALINGLNFLDIKLKILVLLGD